MSDEPFTTVKSRFSPSTARIRVNVAKFKWVCGSETDDKFSTSLNAAIRKAFEENLPQHFDVAYDLDAAVAEALPRALEQFAEDVIIAPCGAKSDRDDMGISLSGLEGDFEMCFDLGEMLLDEVSNAENPREVVEDRLLWLERVANKLRREGLQEKSK